MYFPSDRLLESWILKDHMSIRDPAAGEDVPVMNRTGGGREELELWEDGEIHEVFALCWVRLRRPRLAFSI